YANGDYYSAIVLDAIGIETDMMTPLFAMSRIAGWSAHIIEQWNDNGPIRPRRNYRGPDGRTRKAIGDRPSDCFGTPTPLLPAGYRPLCSLALSPAPDTGHDAMPKPAPAHRLTSLDEAAALVRPGDTLALGGNMLYRRPVAFVRA